MTQKRMALAIVSLCILAEPAMADEMTGFYFGANALNLLSTYRRATLDEGMTAAFGGAGSGYAMGPSSIDRTHVSWTTVGDSGDSGDFSQNTTSVLASVGTSFTLTTHCVLRLDYLRIQKIKERALEREFNVDGMTAGVQYVF